MMIDPDKAVSQHPKSSLKVKKTPGLRRKRDVDLPSLKSDLRDVGFIALNAALPLLLQSLLKHLLDDSDGIDD